MTMNKWRTMFYLLLAVNLTIVVFLSILFLTPAKQENLTIPETSDSESVKFHLQTNKKDLNKVINHYIEEEGLNGTIDYRVLLTDEVELYGTLQIFMQDIEMKLTFEPEALDNGDLILRQKSVSVGKLNLPVSYVMKFVRDNYQLPEWVNIQPHDKLVYVSLQQMKLKSDLKVRVDEFDLKNDQIKVTLLVPTK